ncbi:glycosyltransferase [Flavobacterium faecale]|uniref:glycosyltransferase n=1 Tax=Flavobacterium faecale TaxID=1355330 RepID=UPI003AAA2DD0
METRVSRQTILITVLNWGLGHATRCIPIINQLQEHHFTPIIASDGAALALLKKEFPELRHLELPSYKIQYPKKSRFFKWKLIQNTPQMVKAIFEENKIVNKWIDQFQINGLISDNRLGCYSSKVPSVYITHQINVLTGNTTWISTKLHHFFIQKYLECWIPDQAVEPSLAGILSHNKSNNLNLKHLGLLSRFTKKESPIKYQLLIILSGPEPQRSILETKLITEIGKFNGNILFVKGIIEKDQNITQIGKTTYYNFMTTSELELAINSSELILCRSGYTSIMDLAKLEKKAFFIPTPGQFEQEYLAQHLEINKIAPFTTQDGFSIEALNLVSSYQGFTKMETTVDWKKLFHIFNKKTDN